MKELRNHKLKENARKHDGEVLKKETQQFLDFICSRNSNIVNSLRGHK